MVNRRRSLIFTALAALLAASFPAAAGPTLPQLVEVGDIASLSASPSGQLAVFRLERASIVRNSYQLDWYAADLTTGAVRRIAGGGAPIEGGLEPLAFETVVWSPDERFVFYRALVDGAIGIWRAAVDGSGSRPVMLADSDVESIAGSNQGSSLDFVVGPTRAEIARAERQQYDDGVLVDGSVDLSQNLFRGGWVNGRLATQRLTGRWFSRAGLLWQAPRRRFRLDLQSLAITPQGPVEQDHALSPPPNLLLAQPGRPIVRRAKPEAGATIEIEDRDGASVCAAPACKERLSALAWRPGAEELAFTTRDSHFRQALHLWNVRSGKVRTVAQAEGLMAGSRAHARPCAITERVALCVTAGPVSPPRLERIALASGKRQVLFDPNQTLRRQLAPKVEQLSWRLADGREASGTLLLPAEPAGRAPLFVSYYICPGYLRADAGDAYPLPALVASGFAVGCLDMLPSEGNNVVDYRTGLASVEAFVRLLTARGLIDPARVGMGGFSFGSAVTMWTAINSDLLAAASVASSQATPTYYWSNALPGRDFIAALRQSFGIGNPDDDPAGWTTISPAFNTERIKAPLLMQLPENEARAEVEILARLSRTPTPAELYAFADENHIKFQPRHRLAAYRRSLDWFRYWLQDYTDPDPALSAQYARWDELRRKRDEAQPSNPRNQASAEARSNNRI